MLLSKSVFGFQCGKDNSLENNFRVSERVFMIYVTQVILDKKETQKIELDYPDSAGSVKVLKVDYDVIENFKGNKKYNPKFKELIGIGTGYVGFSPGSYYFVTLPDQQEDEQKNYRYVSFCDVHFQNYRNDVEEYKEILDKASKLVEIENS